MRTNRVEQHRIKKNHKFFPIIDDLCWKSKNMYNYGNYIIRQEFIETSKEKEQGLRESANWIQYNKLFDTAGILFKTPEESFTSGTSFLDGEEPIKENYDKSRRVYRGLFVSNNGTKINADVNGSYQITKKVFPNAYSNGIVGVGLHPTVVTIPL